jgi:hypothetical protein
LFWAWLLSGGSANYGGRWWSAEPYSEIGTQPVTFKDRPNATFRTPLTGLDSVKFIRDYFVSREIELSDFVPDHTLAHDLDGAAEARSPRLMRRGREEYLLYHPNAAADGKEAKANAKKAARVRLDLSQAGGPFAIEWYRAEDGLAQEGEILPGGKQVELTAPWPGHDVVLRLFRR